MTEEQKKKKKRLTDKDMLRGALGGWVGREEAKLLTDPIHSTDGAVEFLVRIRVPAAAANMARDLYQAGTGGWNR